MRNLIILVLSLSTIMFSTERKDYRKSFNVDAGQDVEIETVSGMVVDVVSWDSSKIYFDLKVEINCSDDDFEKEYIDSFEIAERKRNSVLKLEFYEPRDQGWSVWDLFKLKFYYNIEKKIRGTIYLPRNISVSADFRYSDIQLEDISGAINIPGRSNDIYMKNCSNIAEIENPYGNTTLIACGGKLNFETRSSELTINGFNGYAKIQADYSDVKIAGVKGDLSVNSRSGKIDVKDVDGDLKINAPYTEMNVEEISGKADIINRSSSLLLRKVSGLVVDAPYCDLDISEVADPKNQIVIGNRSGSIVMKQITGDLLIDDQYSSIRLNTIEGDVKLKSRSETIYAERLTGNIDLETQYCEIEIHSLDAKRTKISNRSGGVIITYNSKPSEIKIVNEYGKADLTIPHDLDADYELYATYGDVITELPIRIREDGSSSHGYGKVGNGGAKIDIETRSDDIIIREK